MNQARKNTKKKLSLNISSFQRIYENNMIYVDKTPLIYQFASITGQYFLSRPRRFGKSLLVSLLKFLFMGEKKYFEGLWIYDKWDFKPVPVIIFDFNSIGHMTKKELEIDLWDTLDDYAELYQIELKRRNLITRFAELINKIAREHKKIVILVDEYDKPLIDHIGLGKDRLQIAYENRTILKKFFGILKDSDVSDVIQLLFITGISKFSHVSIFSELNNLMDLTMKKEYTTLLGYTQDEVTHYFHPWLTQWAKDQDKSENEIMDNLRRHYDGFRFTTSEERVFNPISILNALDNKDYQNYWFETATPTFLINLLAETRFYLPQIETNFLIKENFSTYELDDLDPLAIMHQTGYLSIKETDSFNEINTFSFDFPNIEVKQAFLKLLMVKYGHPKTYNHLLLSNDLKEKQYDSFVNTLQNIFDQLPKTDQQDANWFHQFFYMVFRSACPESRTLNIEKRLIIEYETIQSVFLVGFSCLQTASDLLECMKDKQIFKSRDKNLYMIGMHFDLSKKNISQWQHDSIIPEPWKLPENTIDTMQIIRFFLASSNEMTEERKEVALWLSRKNKRLIESNRFIELVVWEELLQSFQGKRIQDYFNEQMLTCDIVLTLFYTSVGMFTQEEFNLAYNQLKAGNKPKYLFVGFKKTSTDKINMDYIEIIRLKERIKKHEQVSISFDSIDNLILQLDQQLDLVLRQLN